MTTFDERERAFEAHFALDEELEFRAQVRRDREIARWAGGQMGLSGPELETYVAGVVHADMSAPGDELVYQKIVADLAARNVEASPSAVRAQMNAFLAAARQAVHDER